MRYTYYIRYFFKELFARIGIIMGGTASQKAIKISLLAIGVIALIKFKQHFFQKKENIIEDKIVLQVIKAEKKDLLAYINTYGQVYSGKATDIIAEITSTVKSIKINGHGEVKKNQAILILEPRGAKEEYQGMGVRKNIATADYEAGKELFKKGLISKLELDQMLSKANDANSQLNYTIDNSNPVIKAPFDGVLTEMYVNEGDLVFKQQTKLFTIIKKTSPEIVISLPKRHLKDISLKRQISVVTSYNETIPAKIIRYESVVKPNAEIFTVIAQPINANAKLINGESLHIAIGKKLKSVIKIPHNILVFKDNKRGLMIIENNVIKFIPVKIVFEDGQYIYDSAINQGTQYIITGQNFVKDGTDLTNSKSYEIKFNEESNE